MTANFTLLGMAGTARRVGVVLVALLALAFPWLVSTPALRYLGAFTLMYVGLAVSWNLLGGYTGYISLGHVAFFGLGAYFTALTSSRLELPVIPMILLAGATSSPGRRVLESLRAAGHAVRVLVRGEADARELAERGAEVVRGDARERATLEAARRGAHLFIPLPRPPLSPALGRPGEPGGPSAPPARPPLFCSAHPRHCPHHRRLRIVQRGFGFPFHPRRQLRRLATPGLDSITPNAIIPTSALPSACAANGFHGA